jgi:RNA polymerase sigma-70 factor (ECF subfamily)
MPDPVEKQKELILKALGQFERPLLRYAKNLLNGDEETARDAVQHTFLKLCERPFDDLTGNQAPWLYTVCRNRAMDVWRRSKREPIATDEHSNVVFAREADCRLT